MICYETEHRNLQGHSSLTPIHMCIHWMNFDVLNVKIPSPQFDVCYSTRVDSRDPQTSNMWVWRYHCLGEVVFLKIWNQYWLASDTVHQRFLFISLPICLQVPWIDSKQRWLNLVLWDDALVAHHDIPLYRCLWFHMVLVILVTSWCLKIVETHGSILEYYTNGLFHLGLYNTVWCYRLPYC